jgi:sensor histidine kinase YesM
MSFISTMEAALFLIAAAVIGVMVYGMVLQNHLQIQFMNRTEISDAILADLYDMKNIFREFGRSWTEEEYDEYWKSSRQLEEDLMIFQQQASDAPVTQNYIRRLNNFNIYQLERIERSIGGEESRYDTYSYVMNGLEQHQHQAVIMAQNDMVFARNAYEEKADQVFHRMILAAVAFGTFVVVMGAVLTWFSVITKQTLYAITEYFNRLAESDWDTPDLNTPPYREFSLISQTANRMKKEIRNSITEIENRAKLEKQLSEERLINEKQKRMLVSAQMSALRAQVNPHFLFNSLNLIGVTALVGDSKTVMQMVEATGKILRYSLYHQESMTTLDEELEIVLQYLFLQKSRFGDKVKTEIYNELEGEKILIPTMSIQAIVENCFKHGFGNKKSLYIHISVICDDENISICVMDDGVGFVPEQKLDENKGGIGLSNIKKRMELLYGKENAGIDIESEPGKYTSVTLRIPVKEASCENSDS